MWPAERRGKIMDLLREGGRVTVDKLAVILEISRETVRRDLNQLSSRGLIRKFHGGAELPHGHGESAYHIRMTENVGAKRRIAKRAARMFGTGATIFIDTGTTTVFFSEDLAKREGISVVTNSSVIASTISTANSDNRVFLIGGQHNAEVFATFGVLASEQIRLFHASDVVLSVGALDIATGLTSYLVEEAEIARAMLSRARAVTILCDATKLGKTALFEVCPLDRIDRLVTDCPVGEEFAVALRAADIDVVVASE